MRLLARCFFLTYSLPGRSLQLVHVRPQLVDVGLVRFRVCESLNGSQHLGESIAEHLRDGSLKLVHPVRQDVVPSLQPGLPVLQLALPSLQLALP